MAPKIPEVGSKQPFNCEKSSASGGRSPPDPLPGLHPWTSLVTPRIGPLQVHFLDPPMTTTTAKQQQTNKQTNNSKQY